MVFLLYSPLTRGTGANLAQRLGIAGGEEVPEGPIDLLIRWGSSAAVKLTPKKVLNKKDAIALAANKLDSLVKMKAAQVPVPKTIPLGELGELTLAEVISKGLKFPVLAREPQHTRGADILLCLQNKDLVRAVRWGKTFLVEYIATDREYRVHIFNGEIIRTSQKVLMSRDNYLPYMRNDDHNHTFRNPRKQLTTEQQEIAIKAVQSLGLDFGAVDMVIGDDGKPYVLEVNTGPALIQNGIEIYEEKFKAVIKEIQTDVQAS